MGKEWDSDGAFDLAIETLQKWREQGVVATDIEFINSRHAPVFSPTNRVKLTFEGSTLMVLSEEP